MAHAYYEEGDNYVTFRQIMNAIRRMDKKFLDSPAIVTTIDMYSWQDSIITKVTEFDPDKATFPPKILKRGMLRFISKTYNLSCEDLKTLRRKRKSA